MGNNSNSLKKDVCDKMMKKTELKKTMAYVEIDLTKIDGDGAFQCPKCGTIISPDDESDNNYEIVDTKVKKDELAELVVRCKKCRTTMKLTGFMSQPEA
jgi:predicted RNA-binding Zn-ribbon protein involved in translation (DUF1610 family)